MTRYLRVGKNPRRVLPPTTVQPPTSASNATEKQWTSFGESSAVSSYAVPLPFGIASGDLLVVAVFFYSNSDTMNTPTGWTKENTRVYTVATMDIFYRVCDGTEGTTETFTSSTSQSAAFVCGRIASNGVDFTAQPPESSIGASEAVDFTPDPPLVTPAGGSGNYLACAGWWSFKASVGSLSQTAPSGYTERVIGSSSGALPCVGVCTATLTGVSAVNPDEITVGGIGALTSQAGWTIAVQLDGGATDVAAGNHTHNVNDADDVGTGATTKGDLLVHDGTDYERLAVGSNNQVLTADSAQSLGVKWATAGGGASALNDLTDVTITAATTGEVLQYNGSAWVDAGLPLTDLSNVTISSAVTGEVLKYNGSIWVNDTDDTGSGLPSASAKGDIAVYNGSSWVIRAVGSNDQVLTADSAQSDGVKWATAGGGQNVPTWMATLEAGGLGANDDEFDDASLSGSWTTTTIGGAQTLTESDDLLIIEPTSAIATAYCNTILRSYSISTGEAVEIAVRTFKEDGLAPIFGPVITDGTASGSALCWTAIQHFTSGSLFLYNTSAAAATNSTGISTAVDGFQMVGHTLYLRLEYDAANSFKTWMSGDKVVWHNISTISRTMTPSHIGIGWNTTGGAPSHASIIVEYFRVVTV